MHADRQGRPFASFVLLLAAVSGWGAFLGAWHRLGQAEAAFQEERQRADRAERQADQLAENSQALYREQRGVIRLLQSKLDRLQERLDVLELGARP